MQLKFCWRVVLITGVVGSGFAAEQYEKRVSPGIGAAGRAETNGVAVEALVQEALAKNPELGFYRAEIAAAKAGRRTAGAWRNPELTGSVGQKRVTGGEVGGEGVAWSVSMMQPFEWPGR